MGKYVAAGKVITNRIIFTDNRIMHDIMGGHGLYAYEGVALGAEDSVFVAPVGQDFDQFYGKWFDDNGFSREGLKFSMERCIYNELVYYPDGQYVEYSIYGKEEEAKTAVTGVLTLEDLAPHVMGAKGLYTMIQFPHAEFRALKEKAGFKYMWEYSPLLLQNSGKQAVMDYIDLTDIYSLNRPESFELFGVDNEEAAIAEIKNLGKPCYYRVGSKGAYMIDGGETAFVPVVHVVPREQEIDPTGCGNSSTGGAMWAFSEGFDPLMTCIWGNVVAGFNVMQYGPKLDLGEETRKEAKAVAEKLYKEMKRG